MITPGHQPTDPHVLYRLRDGIYAADLLIVAVAELDLFTWLDGNPQARSGEICQQLDLDARAFDVMTTYLVSLGLLQRGAADSLRLTQLAADHLVATSPWDLRAYYASLRERPACLELLQVLRTGRPASWASAEARQDWSERLIEPAFAQRITAAMDARGRFLGPALAVALDGTAGAGRVLDVGGGSGIYACALLDRMPDMRAAVFECPPVDQAARQLLADRGYADRVDVIAGDMFTDPLPEGYDLHLFSHVLHDWGQEHVRHLIASSFAALPPGGWLVDHDAHIDGRKTGPRSVAEYSVLLMHSTPGKCWSVAELGDMLQEAGFSVVDCRSTTGDRSAVIARKPADDDDCS
ncbi:MAG: methyltransferase [Geodermatophilaceae bacterium]